MKQYLRLIKYLRPYKFRLFMAALCTALASAGTVYLPWIIKDVVEQVLSEKDSEKLTYIALSIVVIFLLRGFFFYGQSYLISYVFMSLLTILVNNYKIF